MAYAYYVSWELQNEEPFCSGIKPHNYKSYERKDNLSKFEDICKNCGLIRIDVEKFSKNFYSENARDIYFTRRDEHGFNVLVEESLRIRQENGLVKLVNQN